MASTTSNNNNTSSNGGSGNLSSSVVEQIFNESYALDSAATALLVNEFTNTNDTNSSGSSSSSGINDSASNSSVVMIDPNCIFFCTTWTVDMQIKFLGIVAIALVGLPMNITFIAQQFLQSRFVQRMRANRHRRRRPRGCGGKGSPAANSKLHASPGNSRHAVGGRNKPFMYFVTSLAISDCLVLISSLSEAAELTTSYWYAGDTACHFLKGFLRPFSIAASNVHVAFMALDRLCTFYRRMQYGSATKRALFLVAMSWLYSLPVPISSYYDYIVQPAHKIFPVRYVCQNQFPHEEEEQRLTIIVVMIKWTWIMLGPMAFTVVSYSIIIYKILRSDRMRYDMIMREFIREEDGGSSQSANSSSLNDMQALCINNNNNNGGAAAAHELVSAASSFHSGFTLSVLGDSSARRNDDDNVDEATRSLRMLPFDVSLQSLTTNVPFLLNPPPSATHARPPSLSLPVSQPPPVITATLMKTTTPVTTSSDVICESVFGGDITEEEKNGAMVLEAAAAAALAENITERGVVETPPPKVVVVVQDDATVATIGTEQKVGDELGDDDEKILDDDCTINELAEFGGRTAYEPHRAAAAAQSTTTRVPSQTCTSNLLMWWSVITSPTSSSPYHHGPYHHQRAGSEQFFRIPVAAAAAAACGYHWKKTMSARSRHEMNMNNLTNGRRPDTNKKSHRGGGGSCSTGQMSRVTSHRRRRCEQQQQRQRRTAAPSPTYLSCKTTTTIFRYSLASSTSPPPSSTASSSRRNITATTVTTHYAPSLLRRLFTGCERLCARRRRRCHSAPSPIPVCAMPRNQWPRVLRTSLILGAVLSVCNLPLYIIESFGMFCMYYNLQDLWYTPCIIILVAVSEVLASLQSLINPFFYRLSNTKRR